MATYVPKDTRATKVVRKSEPDMKKTADAADLNKSVYNALMGKKSRYKSSAVNSSFVWRNAPSVLSLSVMVMEC